jgi:hypothetical protein
MSKNTSKSTQTQATVPSSAQDNPHISGLAITLMMIIFVVDGAGSIALSQAGVPDGWVIAWATLTTLAAFYVLFSLKVARQWEKAIVLRYGKFHGLRGPGLFWIWPLSIL